MSNTASTPIAKTALDIRELRNVFGSFVTGVTVVTTLDKDGKYQGVTANSFSSVSLDPPLVLWSQSINARSFAAFRGADRFIVNILAEHQRDLSQRFAKTGCDKFDGVATRECLGGLPALEECCAWVECRKVAIYPGGDHVVYLGEVLAMERTARRPLAFAQGKYMLVYEHELNFTLEQPYSAHMAHSDAVRIATAALPEISTALRVTTGLGVWGNRGATMVRWEISPCMPVQELRTGIVVSPITSATGLLFSAYLPESITGAALREALAALGGDGSAEATTARALYEGKVAEVRRSGLAMSRRTMLGNVVGFSAPVFDRSGQMVLALSAVKQDIGDATEDALIGQGLLVSARMLSARLGYQNSTETRK